MNGFDWGAFGWNLAAGAGAALAVMLVTFLIALRKGCTGSSTWRGAWASRPSPSSRTRSRPVTATGRAGRW